MGILKDSFRTSKYDFLLKMGFKYGSRSGPRGEFGYTKTFSHNGNERLWITVDPVGKVVYLYNEWGCGGKLWDRKILLTDNVLSMEKNEFIDWLDAEIDKIG